MGAAGPIRRRPARGAAILASLAAHGLAFAWLLAAPRPADRPETDGPPAVLLIQLRSRPAPVQAERITAPGRSPTRPAAVQAPAPPVTSEPPDEAPAPPAAPPRRSPDPGPLERPSSERPAPDLSALAADYDRLLWSRIVARRPAGRNRPGEVVVAFCVGRSGALRAPAVARSSGDQILDALALRAVRNSAPFPAPPGGLDEPRLCFSLPIQFR